MFAVKIKRTITALGLLVFSCASLAPAPLAGQQALLVSEGASRAQIVIAEPPARMARLAAGELQAYLEKITGARLPVVSEPSADYPLRVFVGRSAHTDRLGLSDEGLDHGAFRIVSGENWLALYGRDRDFTPPEPWARGANDRERVMSAWDELTGERWGNPVGPGMSRNYNRDLDIWTADLPGSLNAVHEFLRRLGVRWYLPSELGEVVPETATISLPAIDETVRPDFPLRRMAFSTYGVVRGEDVLWYLRQGLNHGGEIMGLGEPGHGIRSVHSRPETQAEHPEYYLLAGGRRDLTKPCLSSQGLFAQNVKYVRAMFDIYHEPAVSVMPADGYMNACRCDLCAGKATPERGINGQISDYVWDYVNRVAAEVYKTHPDRKVTCFAYGAYLLAPEKIEKLSPNLVVGLIPGTMRGEAWPEADRAAWRAKNTSGQFFFWKYYLHSRPFSGTWGVPAFRSREIAEELRAWQGLSLGDFVEVTLSRPDRPLSGGINSMHAPGFNHLNVYVTARLYWDADQDLDALLDEYYRLFYGPAAAEMKAFIEYSEENWPRMRSSTEAIDRARELLTAARAAAGDGVYGRRAELLVEYCRPLELVRERLAKGRDDAPLAVGRESTDITLDGKLDDPFWTGKNAYPLVNLQTGEPVPPRIRTTFRAGWADNALYFGIRCNDDDMANLNVPTGKSGDTLLLAGDTVEILLETQTHAYYQIVFNPAGALVDFDRRDGVNSLWSSGAEVAVARDTDGWSAEIRVPVAGGDMADPDDPLRGVAGRMPNEAFPWFFNVCRQRVRNNDRSYSAFAPTGKGSFHEPDKFGRLIIR